MDHNCGDILTKQNPLSITRRHQKTGHIGGTSVYECVGATSEGQRGNRGM